MRFPRLRMFEIKPKSEHYTLVKELGHEIQEPILPRNREIALYLSHEYEVLFDVFFLQYKSLINYNLVNSVKTLLNKLF